MFYEPGQVKTSFVSVWLEYHVTRNPVIFYCPRCRCPVFQYSGDLVTMLPGQGAEQPPLIAKCGNRECGLKFMVYGMMKEV